MSEEFDENVKKFRDFVAARWQWEVELIWLPYHAEGLPSHSRAYLQFWLEGHHSCYLLDLCESPSWHGEIQIVIAIDSFETIKSLKTRSGTYLRWIEKCHRWLEEFQRPPERKSTSRPVDGFLAQVVEGDDEDASAPEIAEMCNALLKELLEEHVKLLHKYEQAGAITEVEKSNIDDELAKEGYRLNTKEQARILLRLFRLRKRKRGMNLDQEIDSIIEHAIENIRHRGGSVKAVFDGDPPIRLSDVQNRLKEFRKRPRVKDA